MPYSPINYAALPTAKSPMNALISRAMETFGKGLDLSYKPREKEADIYAKEMSPMVALANDPKFLSFNPEVRNQIIQRQIEYMNKQGYGSGTQAATGPHPTGIAPPADIFKRYSDSLTTTQSPGGQGNVFKSNIAGALTKAIGDNPVSKYLGGENAGNDDATRRQARAEAEQYLSMTGKTNDQISEILKDYPGEGVQHKIERLKPIFLGQNDKNATTDKEAPITSIDQKIARDERQKAEYEVQEDATQLGVKASDIIDDAEYFKTSPKIIIGALKAGVNSDEAMRQYVKGNKNG